MKVIARASQASPHEWQTRIRQAMYCRVNELFVRRGLPAVASDGHLKSLSVSVDGLRKWFQSRKSHWFLNLERRARLQTHFATHSTDAVELVAKAERIRQGEMFLLGHGWVRFEGDDRWRRDPILGVVAPRQHYSRIQYLDSSEVGDSKHVWEPNRFAWAYWLGAAYAITGERAYAKTFRALSMDWFEKNPYFVGVNYCSALEVSLRVYAWVWALDLFHDEIEADRELLDRLIQGVWASCRHIEKSLSYYFAPNTHLLGEAFALFACAAAIPEFDESARWRELGLAILTQEAGKQFHHDGTHKELSTCYHLYATDIYLQTVLIAFQTGVSLPTSLLSLARKASTRLQDLATAELTLPRLNDCDDGRLDGFATAPLNARSTLLAAQSLWPEIQVDQPTAAGSGYHLWMSPTATAEANSSSLLPAQASTKTQVVGVEESKPAERDSGIVTHRSPGGDYVMFRCGPFGYMDCGHSHDGQTSLTISLAGLPVVVDSGTGAYTQTPAIRDRFRGAFGKNIVMLDGEGPSSPGGWFTWRRSTHGTLTHARSHANGFEVAGFHDGFQPACGAQARVTRRVATNNRGTVLVVDGWNTSRAVEARLPWTLHPMWAAQLAACNAPSEQACYWRGVLLDGRGASRHFLVAQFSAEILVKFADATAPSELPARGAANGKGAAPSSALIMPEMRLENGPYSPAYGIVGETPYLVTDCQKSQNGCLLTVFTTHGELSLTSDSAGRFVLRAGGEMTAIVTLATAGVR